MSAGGGGSGGGGSSASLRSVAGGYGMTGGSSGPDRFTPEMRDRQARGKDPYAGSSSSADISIGCGVAGGLDPTGKMRLGSGELEREPFERAERRANAAAVLDNPELLMMYAQRSGDSIPATRLRFTRILCGYDDPLDADPTRQDKESATTVERTRSTRT